LFDLQKSSKLRLTCRVQGVSSSVPYGTAFESAFFFSAEEAQNHLHLLERARIETAKKKKEIIIIYLTVLKTEVSGRAFSLPIQRPVKALFQFVQ
jgi:hypothetical protein